MLLKIVANIFAWAAIQLGLVIVANRIPSQRFAGRVHRWERNGRVYHSLGVRRWKDKLPDGGGWFANGFSKRSLRSRCVMELDRFAREARRGELVHWCALGALPIFALWNTRAGMLVNASYAIVANLPCIIVQRYNRVRISAKIATSRRPTTSLAETIKRYDKERSPMEKIGAPKEPAPPTLC